MDELRCFLAEQTPRDEIEYERLREPRFVGRIVKPVGVMFLEYYFYLIAFTCKMDKESNYYNKDDWSPTIYRIDRIRAIRVTKEHFPIPWDSGVKRGTIGQQQKVRTGRCLWHLWAQCPYG